MSARVETVAESWQTYHDLVMPKTAGPVQVNETRNAFYAGAYFSLMNLAYNIGDDETTEEQGLAMLDALKREIEDYAKGIRMPLPRAVETPVDTPAEAPDISHTVPDRDNMRRTINELALLIRQRLPSGYGFMVLAFNFGGGGNMFYASNADRGDMLLAIREFLQKQVS